MVSQVMERLLAARNERFVGRQAEQDLFRTALEAEELPFLILNFYGPGGFGKTALLDRLWNYCRQRHIPAFAIDGQNIEPTPDGFMRALSAAMGLENNVTPGNVLNTSEVRQVLLIDTFERLVGLEPWLRESFLPYLSTSILTVIAGHHPVSLTWRSDPGWQPFIRTVPLHNLTPEESHLYLTKRQIPPEDHTTMLSSTYGHPLALSVMVDTYLQQGPSAVNPVEAADMLRVLVERFVQHVPSATHRLALETCALLRTTDEAILTGKLAEGSDGNTG